LDKRSTAKNHAKKLSRVETSGLNKGKGACHPQRREAKGGSLRKTKKRGTKKRGQTAGRKSTAAKGNVAEEKTVTGLSQRNNWDERGKKVLN